MINKNLKNTVFILLASVLLLSACGIKPSSLTPPGEAEKDNFPHTYPAPSTIE